MAAKSKEDKKAEEIQADVNAGSDLNQTADKKSKKKDKPKKKGKKGKKKIFVFLILLLLLAGIVSVFVFNPFNLRDEYIYPTLRNVPLVKNIIPEDPNAEKDEYSDLTKEQLIVEYKKLQSENKNLEDENKNLQDKISDSDGELTRLREIEANQLEFRAEKEEFDRMIAENDPNAYKTFYESVSPENAEKFYKEIIQQQSVDKELKDYVQSFENMKKDAAAKVLEEMIGTDMDLVVRILSNISSEQRANILSSMEPQNAAAAVKRMAPEENNKNQ